MTNEVTVYLLMDMFIHKHNNVCIICHGIVDDGEKFEYTLLCISKNKWSMLIIF